MKKGKLLTTFVLFCFLGTSLASACPGEISSSTLRQKTALNLSTEQAQEMVLQAQDELTQKQPYRIPFTPRLVRLTQRVFNPSYKPEDVSTAKSLGVNPINISYLIPPDLSRQDVEEETLIMVRFGDFNYREGTFTNESLIAEVMDLKFAIPLKFRSKPTDVKYGLEINYEETPVEIQIPFSINLGKYDPIQQDFPDASSSIDFSALDGLSTGGLPADFRQTKREELRVVVSRQKLRFKKIISGLQKAASSFEEKYPGMFANTEVVFVKNANVAGRLDEEGRRKIVLDFDIANYPNIISSVISEIIWGSYLGDLSQHQVLVKLFALIQGVLYLITNQDINEYMVYLDNEKIKKRLIQFGDDASVERYSLLGYLKSVADRAQEQSLEQKEVFINDLFHEEGVYFKLLDIFSEIPINDQIREELEGLRALPNNEIREQVQALEDFFKGRAVLRLIEKGVVSADDKSDSVQVKILGFAVASILFDEKEELIELIKQYPHLLNVMLPILYNVMHIIPFEKLGDFLLQLRFLDQEGQFTEIATLGTAAPFRFVMDNLVHSVPEDFRGVPDDKLEDLRSYIAQQEAGAASSLGTTTVEQTQTKLAIVDLSTLNLSDYFLKKLIQLLEKTEHKNVRFLIPSNQQDEVLRKRLKKLGISSKALSKVSFRSFTPSPKSNYDLTGYLEALDVENVAVIAGYDVLVDLNLKDSIAIANNVAFGRQGTSEELNAEAVLWTLLDKSWDLMGSDKALGILGQINPDEAGVFLAHASFLSLANKTWQTQFKNAQQLLRAA